MACYSYVQGKVGEIYSTVQFSGCTVLRVSNINAHKYELTYQHST